MGGRERVRAGAASMKNALACRQDAAERRSRRGLTMVLIWLWAARSLCFWRGDLNRPMTFSRLLVGLCAPSIRLLKPLWAQWSAPSVRSLIGLKQLCSLSVITARGWPNRRTSLFMKRRAALAFRRGWTRISSTSPLASIARHSQCFTPFDRDYDLIQTPPVRRCWPVTPDAVAIEA